MVVLRKPLLPWDCFKQRRRAGRTCDGCFQKAVEDSKPWTPRAWSWCTLCGASFAGHPKCAAQVSAARKAHEAQCHVVIREPFRLRSE